MKLVLCRECTRHARADERACPFCGAPLPAAGMGTSPPPSRGLARAQLYALQGAVAGGVLATAAACGGKEANARAPDATLTDSGNDSASVNAFADSAAAMDATDAAENSSMPDAPSADGEASSLDAASSQDAAAGADAAAPADAAEESVLPIPPYGGVFPPGAGDEFLV